MHKHFSSEVTMMSLPNFVTVTAAFGFLVGCRPTANVAQLTQSLLETDRAWGKLAATSRSPDSVAAYWTDDARVALPGQAVLSGKAAIIPPDIRAPASPADRARAA